jgi:hypothetical protein
MTAGVRYASKVVFQAISFRSVLTLPKVNNMIPKSQQHKFFHSEECFKSWINKKSKSIYSNRQSITYETRIKANGAFYFPRMVVDMYTVNHLRNLKFLLTIRRTLPRNNNKDVSVMNVIFLNFIQKNLFFDPDDRLLAAKRKSFLFTPEQTLRKRILHLEYKKSNLRIPELKDYLFRVPYFFLFS